jgi:hypothetical protein
VATLRSNFKHGIWRILLKEDSAKTVARVGVGGRGSPGVPFGPRPGVSGPQRAADAAARRRGDRGESEGDAGEAVGQRVGDVPPGAPAGDKVGT